MQIQKVIEQLGYSPNEAKVYLATLALGEAHISDIAVKAKLPRSSTQEIIEKLLKDGVVTFYVRRRYKRWVAENPEHLLQTLKKRQETVAEAMPVLTGIMKAAWKKIRRVKGSGSLGPLRILADELSVPVLITNANVEIEYVNAPWQELVGYSMDEVSGQNPRILKSGKTAQEVYDRLWTALEAGKMFQSDEFIDKKKDGTLFSLATTIFPVKHGGKLYYVQILDDTTEQDRARTFRLRFG